MSDYTAKFIARFWSRVQDMDNECRIWTGGKDAYGYGQVSVSGHMRKAHRVAYTLAQGSIPDGMQIDHECHQRACVNPAHLRAVTPKQNSENRAGAQSNSKSGVRGVSWDPQLNKWIAIVNSARKRYYCGHFADIDAADLAARAKRSELFTHNAEGPK